MALSIRVLAVLLPIGGGVAVSVILSRSLPRPGSVGATIGWWAVLLAGSAAAVFALDRAGRRLLPLAALYRMTLVFPDQMPSRYRIARQAGRVRDLQDRVREAREHGLDDDPTRQAETVLALITGLSDHDTRTRGHSERVRVFADMLAEELDLHDEDRERFRWAALLHDIGKLTVPEPILNKAGRPDDEEWERLRAHPSEGGRLLEPLRDWLGGWVGASVDHHERWDGSGYPRGLSGEDISLGGRVVAVCDAFEVMTAARAYKEPATVEEARQELAACAGTHFDPAIVRAFLNLSVSELKLRVGLLAWLAQLPLVRTGMRVPRPVTVGLATVVAVVGLTIGDVGATAATETTMTVPGTSNPWLAGMPDGTNLQGDSAPDHAPVLVDALDIRGGQLLRFAADGSVSFGGEPDTPPDGQPTGSHRAAFGIAPITVGWNALVGVFLDDQQPDQAGDPPPGLEFATPESRDAAVLRPGLRQPFFIGDGIRSDGTTHVVEVPAGATRLFLGTVDGHGWYNNKGAFTVTVAIVQRE